jgi:hypothetical protein
LAGAAGALLLQGGFLLLFLASMPQIAPPLAPGRELVFILPHIPTPLRAAPPRARTRGPSRPVAAPAAPSLQIPSPAIVPPSAIPGLRDFGQALNGCSPEQYRNLPPDQQAHCRRPGEGVTIAELPNLMGSPSHVKDEAHWEAELARKQSPIWLPCFGPINGVPSINFICIAGMAAKGQLTDPRSWPIYQTKQLAREDFYKIEQTYDAWNKEHLGAPQTASPSDALATNAAHGMR